MIRAEDLQIMVTTFERARLLRETLSSICAQTVRGFNIVVLDNGSRDDTERVVSEFTALGVEYSRFEENMGSYVNFLKAQKLAGRKWVMVFHDDDLMHPEYVSTVLKAINSNDGLVLVGSRMSIERDPKALWKNLKGRMKIFDTPSSLAAFLYNGFPMAYCSVVYRTDIFKTTEMPNSIYGKISDRPFIYDVARHGRAAVLTDSYVKYRLHAGQDIFNNDSGPYQNELIALRRKYRELLGEDVFTRNGRIFVMNLYKGLRSESRARFSLDSYIKCVVSAGAASRRSVILGKTFFPIVLIRDNARRLMNRVRRYI